MAKQPTPLDKMTKAQLVVALKKAYKRIAALEALREALRSDMMAEVDANKDPFPWQQVLNDTKGL